MLKLIHIFVCFRKLIDERNAFLLLTFENYTPTLFQQIPVVETISMEQNFYCVLGTDMLIGDNLFWRPIIGGCFCFVFLSQAFLLLH